MDDLVADGYDAVYAAWSSSPTLHALWREHAAGDQQPPAFENLNFLTGGEVGGLVGALALRPGEWAADLACGAGGLSIWLAQRSAARVVGIDVSRVGVRTAARSAVEQAVTGAVFVTGAADALPLSECSIAGVVSVDALQYLPDKRAALRDVARVLRRSGRFVFTAFELDAERVSGLPVLGVDPTEDYSPLLEGAGLRVDTYEETLGWQKRVRAAFGALSRAKDTLKTEMGDEAADSLLLEAALTLDVMPYRRRIFAVATKASA